MEKQIIFILVFFLCTACAKNPVTNKHELMLVSETQESAFGKELYQQMIKNEGGAYTKEPSLTKRVQKVGKKLAKVSDRPNLDYEFTVLDNSVPNAWALPGGKIAINKGLLDELTSDDELAAVLAHEIVHVAARHSAEKMERALFLIGGLQAVDLMTSKSSYKQLALISSELCAILIEQRYSRLQELEADEYGIKYMYKAGYDPMAAVSLQETFLRLQNKKESSWFSGLFASHPPTKERLEKNRKTAILVKTSA